MKKLLIYLKEYKKECVLAPVFKMLEAILELFVPLAVAALIDEGIGHGRKGYIFGMVGLLILMAAFGLAVAVTAQYFAAKAAVGFATNLRQALFSHLLKFSYTEIDEMGASTMITRMTTDIGSAQNGVNMVLRLLLRSPFVVFGAMIMAFTIDPWSATIFVMVICGLSVCVFSIMNFHIPMMKKIQQKLDKLTGAVRENLTGVRVLRAFVKEKEEIGRFSSRNEALLEEQEKTGMVSGLLNPLTFVVVNVGIILLLRTGALQVGRGALSRGSVVALYNYMSQILVELIKLANLIVTINKALAGADRISEALAVNPSMVYGDEAAKAGINTYTDATQTESGIEGTMQSGEHVVSFEHVSLTYKGAGQEALSDISFNAGKGQVIGIIGGTGCGKSSLVNLIPRFYEATRGRVLVDGVDVRAWEPAALRAKIGLVPQKATLFLG
ncbi:MAG: ABC transporter ATP-binding protein, partial [Lachnospiraceae bacterium]|nr:ABC transporter ATP-binding protein [Lachnospiraceae bacterium]